MFDYSLEHSEASWHTRQFVICFLWPFPKWDYVLTVPICLYGKWKSLSHVDSLWPHGLYSPWNSPGQNTGVGSLSLLQRIFPTQGLNSGLPHCRQILFQMSHKGSPRILGWVAMPSSRGSSQPRDQIQVSHIAGRFFTGWATREAPEETYADS